MKTTVPGFPRIGAHRELKFSTEKWFRKEISDEELQTVASSIRLENWKLMNDKNISYIPSNDFSLYDSMLDAAVLFGAIPKRFRSAPLSPLERYFALARGHQDEKTDLRALTMTKWFNTNYHFIIPELADDISLSLVGDKPFAEYKEAKEAGIETRPVFIGPFTFLSLAVYTGEKSRDAFASEIGTAWKQILARCAAEGIKEIQIDEPSLVTDLTTEDVNNFTSLYQDILAEKGPVRIHLHTAYGDIRDVWKEVVSLNFDSVGLDFIEGYKNLDLLKEHGFPSNINLTAGVFNGKNIWRANPKTIQGLISQVSSLSGCSAKNGRLTVGIASTLLHIPVSVKIETNIDPALLNRLSFATEKLEELVQAGVQADNFVANGDIKLPSETNTIHFSPSDTTVRVPARNKRKEIQSRRFTFPFLPATTIGSFPQTAEVRENRARFRRGEINQESYEDTIHSMIKELIKFQESIGLDVLVYGEFERNDMVEFFGENLEGFAFTKNGWVQSYGTRCVKPPIIYGDVSRTRPMTVSLASYAQSLTPKPVKGMLTGPVTILNWSFPREDVSPQVSAFQIARAIRDEVLDLEKNGIGIIQIDEAAFKEKLPLRQSEWKSLYLDWAIPAFRITHSSVKPETQIHTHMCYSDFTGIIDAIDDMDADVISFEASRSNLSILDSLADNAFETSVGPGVYDIHSPRVPPTTEIEAAIRIMIDKLEITHSNATELWINPDCGLKTRGNSETRESLINMIEATRKIRSELSCTN